jgi:methionine-rich copper-binding protein CopC
MKPRTSQIIRLVVIVVLGVMFQTLLKAHAKLEKTEPIDGMTVVAPPPHIQLWFDEEVDVKVSKIELGAAPLHRREMVELAVISPHATDGRSPCDVRRVRAA